MLTAPLTLGIEEEYQLIDRESRQLKAYIQELLNRGKVHAESGEIKPEFMQSQIEMGTRVCHDVQELRGEVKRLRKEIITMGDETGIGIAAAATHPFSRWADQAITDRERYLEFAQDMQHVIRNLLIFGMHVHIGFGDSPPQRELMITIMNQMRYFLPHILALSASSPFWMGEETGLKSYRSIVFKAMPRTGLPMVFASWEEYDRLIKTMAKIGALGKGNDGRGDATRLWWDLRPHPKFGTLEIRICDIATTVDEAVCIAALLQALAAKLITLRQNNQQWRVYPRDLIDENKWRAVRYGTEGKLIDFGKQIEVPLPDLIDEMVDMVSDVADELGSLEEVSYARTIAREGSSADRQIRVYRDALAQGESEEEALRSVVDHLVRETRQGVC
jgi:carboxylate-amine ligase